jgi:hypothetical protein
VTTLGAAGDGGEVSATTSTEGRRPFRIKPQPEAESVIPSALSRFDISTVDVAFALIVFVSTVAYFRLFRASYFWGVDWPLALRGQSRGDFLQPYDKQLGVVVLVLYRSLYKVFGFDSYAPWRIAGVAALVTVPVALFFVLRTKTGPFIAAVVATYFLWFPHTSVLTSSIGDYIALFAAVVCTYLLTRRDGSSDLAIAGLLVLALASSGAGLAIIAACAVYSLSTRAGFRRWFAIIVPTAAWLAWWLKYARESYRAPANVRLDFGHIVRTAFDGIRGSFDALMFGNRILGTALAIVFLLHLGWRLRSGITASANALAWSAALIVWWAMLVYTRGELTNIGSLTERLVGAVFIVLAAIPPERLSLPERWRSPIAAVTLVVVAGLIGLANHGGIADEADARRVSATSTRRALMTANLGAEVVPDSRRFSDLGGLTAGEYRQVIALYGMPAGSKQGLPTAPEGQMATDVRSSPKTISPSNSARAIAVHSSAVP